MPNYDYLCPECGHTCELTHSVAAQPPTCPECGTLLKKQFKVATPVVYKCSGFYESDHHAH